MRQSPSETDSCSADQEITRRVLKSPVTGNYSDQH